MNDMFEKTINKVDELLYFGVLDTNEYTLIKEALTVGRLYRDLDKTIDTYKRVAIKEEIKQIEGVEE